MGFKKKFFKKYLKTINYWPPFLGSGIKVEEINEDRTRFLVSLRLTSRNKNLFGTQFGGSLYAMTDPFFVFILILNMGDDYIIWDRAASIEFIKPGKEKVFADMSISQERIAEIKQEIEEIGKSTYTFETQITDKHQNVIAKVSKEVYIRKKNFDRKHEN
jgi:acyl-coenzyme A thioesterase PaaI-like protein